ncbi:Thermosensitive gluconokinase [Wickerhamomyces ciferrii]|uniref:Gluconokinase n=1 Tax=Wickerhamomyces ciferrii (strain ATCC 14091 / BCRC 22168 / CBS 111 / JCM 3599 / NBRC 0793 / NRRL Y-1031 F-60-10) TaxID=1206466 RepID=K0K893_WICCF|nr:Thermosensitive gluconokinase [Wickerhamomyces ciferrii]CCH41050.1 Thermosensitive gluconokinase [Wickerhamomyces ciferrii]
MSNNIPLQDEDRWGWLEQISLQSAQAASEVESQVSVVSCSSLKKVYRDLIRSKSSDTKFIFIFLYATKEELIRRTELRPSHYMKSSMVESQFAILELPKPEEESNTTIIDATKTSIGDVTAQTYAYTQKFI